MTDTPNLALAHVEAAQNQKEVTINAAFSAIDQALTEILAVDVSAGDAQVTPAQARRAAALSIGPAAAAGRTVGLPAVKRLLAVRLDKASAHPVALVRGAASIALAPGATGLFHLDGSADGLAQAGGASADTGGASEAYADQGDAATLAAAKSYADQVAAAVVNSSPEALNTLKELSDALGADPNFAATMAAALGQKAATAYVDAADAAIRRSVADTLPVSVAAGNAAVPSADMAAAVALAVSGATVAGRVVSVPAAKKLFVASLAAASTQPVSIAVGTASFALQPNTAALFYADGSANSLQLVASGVASSGGGAVANPLDLTAASGARAQVRAAGADANVSLVLAPKGNGALQAQDSDGAAAGGNARGANAVDWQRVRSAASMVASGLRSFIGGGQSNTASGTESTVGGGAGNTASGLNATAAGGSGNTASGAYSAASGGSGNAASNTHATVSGGQNNTASATHGSVGGGNSNEATGAHSTAAGGDTNRADGAKSWVPGGTFGNTRGIFGKGAWGSGHLHFTRGDTQAGELVVRGITADAAAKVLTSDNGAAGAANQFAMPNNSLSLVTLLVEAQQTTGTAGAAGDCASWLLLCTFKRRGGASSLVGVTAMTGGATLGAFGAGAAIPPMHSDAAAAGFRVALSADGTNGALAVTATAEANKTVDWVSRLLSVETHQ